MPRSDVRVRRPDGASGIWLAGGALALSLLAIVGLLLLLAWQAWDHFAPRPLVEFELEAGTTFPGVRLGGPRILAEVWDREPMPAGDAAAGRAPGHRIKVRLGSRDLFGNDFAWVDERAIVGVQRPADAVRIERREDGPCFARLVAIRGADGRALVSGGAAVLAALPALIEQKTELAQRIEQLTRVEIGEVNRAIDALRLAERRLERRAPPEAERIAELARIAADRQALDARFTDLAARLDTLRAEHLAERLVVAVADSREFDMPVGVVLSCLEPNALGVGDRIGLYAARVAEFVFGQPRESNTEGGIFPAIFGTVLMVFLMTLFVTPLGVLAALYLREYARQGTLVRLVRVAVNNLAGVPSIVFGVFGFGFFVYLIGGAIDEIFYADALPKHTFGTGGILWAACTLALLTLPVVIVATEEGLAAVPRIAREGSLALGATKWETTYKVVLPAAAPAVLTGVILAIARAAGEVAPLMIVGMVKLADLPVDHHFPYLHLDAKFMHLGFHIYDVGFQSPDVEATRPLVYATALLLVLLVFAMNLLAVVVRNRLRRRYATATV